jgi:hypothetical protein
VFPNVEAFSNIESEDSTGKKNSDSEYVALKGKAWWGSNNLDEGDAETQGDCEAMCSNDNKCSGATFNPVKKYCWTRTGDGEVTTGEDDEYALVPKKTQALIMMKGLNEQLLELNKQISDEINNINPKIEEQAKDNIINQIQLEENQQTLQEEKDKIKALLKDTNELTKENTEISLYAYQENIWIRFWILATCLILFITLTQMSGMSMMTNRLLMMIVLMVVTYTLSSPSGFVLLIMVLLGIIGVMMKSKQE